MANQGDAPRSNPEDASLPTGHEKPVDQPAASGEGTATEANAANPPHTAEVVHIPHHGDETSGLPDVSTSPAVSPSAQRATEQPTNSPPEDPHHDVHGDPHHHHDPAYDEYAHHSGEESSHYHHHHEESSQTNNDAVVPPGGNALPGLFDSDGNGEGGPVKTFLEHLEDFRWIVIKCATAIAIAMVVCLLAANWVVALLKWPLERAGQFYPDKRQHVSVMFGPKQILEFKLTNGLPGWPIATNRFVELELVPFEAGTNQVLALRVRSISNNIPAEKAKPLIYKDPMEVFINPLHIAFYAGLLLAAPLVVFFIAQFVLPALRARERQYFFKAMAPAVLLFALGVSLAYFLLLPLGLNAADKWAAWMGVEMPFWQATDYFGFCIKLMLAMGLSFELPVVLLAFVKIGLLNHTMLAGFRKYMIVINLVIGAMIAPEVLTQAALFVPLQLLYEITIWIAWYWDRQDKKKFAREAAAGGGK